MNEQQFLSSVELTEAQVAAARISVADLIVIYKDHEARSDELLRAGEAMQSTLRRIPGVHSTRVRIKTPVSLIRKIVRKCSNDYERNITPENYREDIRDLIGLRALHLFKDDWRPIHDEIINIWDLHQQELEPKAYYRLGDSQELHDSFVAAGCNPQPKEAGYRSIHYVIVDHPNKRDFYYAEIQVRTIFEEAWSEIDHQVRYPDYSDDALLKEYLLVLNRVAGSADEMASFLLKMRQQLQMLNALEREKDKEKREVENELQEVRLELEKAVKDKQISENQKQKMEAILNRIPRHFQQSPSEMERVLNREAVDINQRMRAFLGNPPGLTWHDTIQKYVDQQQRHREDIERHKEKLRMANAQNLGFGALMSQRTNYPAGKQSKRSEVLPENSQDKPSEE